jgi:hypothetical protein
MSGEANAAESDIPPPQWGVPLKVTLKSKSFFSADYNVNVGDGEQEKTWMLLDAVGGMFDAGYAYYLKHRAPGQVDAEGKPASTTLGAVNIKGEWDAFSFQIAGADRDISLRPFMDIWDKDIDFGITKDRTLWAVWTYSKRAILFADHEQTKQIGWLDVTGSGTWYEHEEQVTVYDTDQNGNRTARQETRRTVNCKTNGFRYKFNVFNCPMQITYRKEGRGFFKSSKLHFTAANAFDPNTPLFNVESDGGSNCTITSYPNSDPISTILAAYAISCKLDPDEFNSGAKSQCERHMSLGMHPGFSNFIGMDERSFEQKFSYPAPPPPVFAQQVAAFVMPQSNLIPFAQSPMAVQPGMGMGMGMMQPGMVQPGMMQQGMMQPGMMQPGMMQPGMMQPGMMQPGMMQPGMMQPGMMQPGMMQPGMMQPQQGMMMQPQQGMMMQPQPGMMMQPQGMMMQPVMAQPM